MKDNKVLTNKEKKDLAIFILVTFALTIIMSLFIPKCYDKNNDATIFTNIQAFFPMAGVAAVILHNTKKMKFKVNFSFAKCVDVEKNERYNKTRRKVQLMDTNALNELVEGILAIFNTQVIRIVLYGSYARGNNTSESDVDVALLLNGNLNESTEDKLSDLVVDLNLKYDKVFSVIDIDYAVFKKWEKVTPFYKNVNKEGIVLWKAA